MEEFINTSHERVLCFPRTLLDSLGSFQGFRADDGTFVEAILTSGKASFIERAKAEDDSSVKQLIPYVVLMWEDKFLYYIRGKKSGESRLRALGSVGIGGHISVSDHGLFEQDTREAFFAGLTREVAEEVKVQSGYTQRLAGLINDDSNPVGKVHLGVLILWELAEPEVSKRERAITSLEFLTIEELKKRRDKLETWSQIVIDNWSRIQR